MTENNKLYTSTECHQLLTRLLGLINQESIRCDNLEEGRSSIALLLFYYGYYFEDDKYLNEGTRLIEDVFNGIISNKSTLYGYNFCYGLTGFLSIIVNLQKHNFLEIDLKNIQLLEKSIAEWAITELSGGNIDFIMGPAGVMSYFIQRIDLNKGSKENELARHYLLEMLVQIRKILQKNTSSFYTIPNMYYNEVNKREEGEVNYSLAHGMASLIINLLELQHRNIYVEECKPVIDNVIQTIVKLKELHSPRYPHFFVNLLRKSEKVDYYKRLAWCQSDLNLLHIFSLWDKINKDKRYQSLVKEGITMVTNRKYQKENLLEDPFLCHGFSGVAQYYLKLYDLTKDKKCMDSYTGYISKILNFYNNHSDKYFLEPSRNQTFLYGNVGVALTLITAIEPASSMWSKIILL